MRLSRRPHGLPHRRPEIRGYIYLEAELAGKAHPKEPHRHPADPTCGYAHVRQRGGADVDVHEAREHLPRVRPLHGDHRPLLGCRGEPDRELRPLGLKIILHHREHPRGAAGGGRDVEAVRREPRDNAIVIHVAIIPQQDAVARPADGEGVPRVYIQAIHEGDRIGTHHLDLAERGGIE